METEQPLVRISVRNLVEFILRSGDIDNRAGGQTKMQCSLEERSIGRSSAEWEQITTPKWR